MTCRQAITIATGPGRAPFIAASIEAAAAELHRRATSPGHLWVRPAALAAPGLPTAVLAVRDRGQDNALLGYVCGLGHDQDVLAAALDEPAPCSATPSPHNQVVSGSTGSILQPQAAGVTPCSKFPHSSAAR